MKHKLLTVICLALSVGSAFAQTTVNWSNFSSTPATQDSILFRDFNGTALSQGVATANTDGFLVQLGYFSTATTAANFSGTWIPITGFGAAVHTSIGDTFNLSGAGAGQIQFNTFFSAGTNSVEVYDAIADPGFYVTQSSVTITNNVPMNGQVLAIRFYDSASGTTGRYNTVSADNWIWQSPNTPGGGIVSINLASNFTGSGSAPALEFQDANNAFRTAILIPEPSTYAFIGLGVLGLMVAHRRGAKSVA